MKSKEWHTIFDFIERYLKISKAETSNTMCKIYCKILKDEAFAYRILNNQVVLITNDFELKTIEEASGTSYNAVNTHIAKALDLFSNRKNTDYENSIKESISAVEAMCCIITGMSGASATLVRL